jgi:hypothetical protein
MKLVVRIIAGLFFVLAVIVWFTQIRPVHSVLASSNAPITFSLNSLQAGTLAAASSTVPIVTRTGIVIIDMSSGAPGTPYLAFEDTNGHFYSEELIFDSSRGCQISAGEADCAANLSDQEVAGDIQYPVIAGEVVTVTGPEIDQTLHVTQFTQQNVPPANMVVFNATEGNTVTLSDGLSLRITNYSDSAACTLGIGCFGNGTPQETVTLTYNPNVKNTKKSNDSKTSVLVTGQFNTFGGDTVILLSAPNSTTSTLLVASK